MLAALSAEGLVDLEQAAVDGTQVRAQCATSSERRLLCCPGSYERGRPVSRAEESETMARHREWMQSEPAKAAEFSSARLKERCGVRKFRVRLHRSKPDLLPPQRPVKSLYRPHGGFFHRS